MGGGWGEGCWGWVETHTVQTYVCIAHYNTNLPGSLRQSICIGDERVLCFHFLGLSDYMSATFLLPPLIGMDEAHYVALSGP